MSVKLMAQIIIFIFCFLAIVGLLFEKDGITKSKAFLLFNLVLIIAYIITF